MKLNFYQTVQSTSVPGTEVAILKDSIEGDSLVIQKQNIRYFVKLSDIYQLIKHQENNPEVDDVNG